MSKVDMSTSKAVRSRNAQATSQAILESAIVEFCEYGLNGASTSRIVERAGCNIRMLYHYFQNKETLYKAALEQVYNQLRGKEAELSILDRDPMDAIKTLTAFTFDYMRDTPAFIKLVLGENLLQGEFISTIPSIPRSSRPFIQSIQTQLDRGVAAGIFRSGIDATQLYISIVSLSFMYLSSQYTLSVTFGVDISSEENIRTRRLHVVDMIEKYLRLGAE